MDDSQITGATSSYARKYALNGLFLIDDTKDADSRDNSEPKVESKPVTVKQEIVALLKKLGVDTSTKKSVEEAVTRLVALEVKEGNYEEIRNRGAS